MKSLVDFLENKENILKKSLAETELLKNKESCLFIDNLCNHDFNELNSVRILLSKSKNIINEELRDTFITGYQCLKIIEDYILQKKNIYKDIEIQKKQISESVKSELMNSLNGEIICSVHIFMYKKLRKNRDYLIKVVEEYGWIVSEKTRKHMTFNLIAKNEKEVKNFLEEKFDITNSLYCEHVDFSKFSIYKHL